MRKRPTPRTMVCINNDLITRKELDVLKERGLKAVTAETCTGGLIATTLSEAPGAAEHFEGVFVVYYRWFTTSLVAFRITFAKADGLRPGCEGTRTGLDALERYGGSGNIRDCEIAP
jgi:hypothetical protein